MVIAGRRKTIALFIALGAGLILVILLLYIGWVLLNWRTGILLFLGVLLLAFIITGVVLNTIFLVREIRRNEQHDAFINAVTHELKTPVASIRLYLETLQTRAVDEAKRAASSIASCWTTATACWRPSSRCCAPGAWASQPQAQSHAHRSERLWWKSAWRARARCTSVSPEALRVPSRRRRSTILGDPDEVRAADLEPDRQRREILRATTCEDHGGDRGGGRQVSSRAGDETRGRASRRPS